MNERIRELAEHAELPNPHVPGQWRFNNQQLGFFAELIVRECLAHGKSIQSQTIVNGSEEYIAGREMGIEVFMNEIKKHFGVEE